MRGPLEGVKVIELASWMFIPSGGSVLVDWGAEVIKVEHPVTGDPQRGLISSGLVPGGAGGVNFMIEQPNRGKKSVGIDLANPDGREVFLELVETADVLLTNYLPQVRRKLGIDTDAIRERNPDIIIARGSGQGPLGPDAEDGGYDGASYWARGGLASVFPEGANGYPAQQSSPAFGDVMGGMATAGAIAAALFKRSTTGEPSIVDVSLLATAMWNISPLVVASKLFGFDKLPAGDRTATPNPGVGTYKTKDDRFITFILLQSEKHWEDWVTRLGRPDMIDDPRFATAEARTENKADCIGILDEVFAGKTLDEWKQALEGFAGVWTPVQTLAELYEDPQVIANGYLPTMTTGNGEQVQLVANPAMFDESPVEVDRAPEHGEHTEIVLMDAGLDWDRIAALKDGGAVL
jgi:crotonobetainyl-CoA:carnitine CoA-transferase CaiB-like acyl-CoA transferase